LLGSTRMSLWWKLLEAFIDSEYLHNNIENEKKNMQFGEHAFSGPRPHLYGSLQVSAAFTTVG
jgi:hypothetical protein